MRLNAHTPAILVSLIFSFFLSSFQVKGAATPNDHQLPYYTSNQTLPQYALDFAPLVYLHSDEVFWPSVLSQHFDNVQPEINFTRIDSYVATGQSTQAFLSSSNLQKIDPSQEELIYLSSKESIFDLNSAAWYNIMYLTVYKNSKLILSSLYLLNKASRCRSARWSW